MPLPPPILLGLIVVFSWASSFPVIQMALEGGISPVPLGALRCLIAFLSLLPVFSLVRANFKPNKKDFLRIFLTGGAGFGVYSYLLNAGEVTVSSGVTSLVMASTPIFASLLANLVTEERLTAFGWAGSVIAFIGVAMLSILGREHSEASGLGIAILICAAIINGIYAVYQRPIVHKFGGFRAVLYLIGAGALVLSPWLPQGITELSHAPTAVTLEVIWLSLVPSVIGYACWGFLIGAIGPSKGGLFLYGVAPTALIMSWFLLHQEISLTTALGGLVIILGVALSRLQRKHFRSLQKPF